MKNIRFFPNITATKTATISGLKLQLQTQSTIVAQAEAKNESLQTKKTEFETLLNDAKATLTSAETNWNEYLNVSSDIQEADQAAGTSSEVSQSSYALAQKMLQSWQAVGQLTLKAATQINQTTEYIQKRKAANPLISNDLVNDAVTANKNAASSVKVVITALQDAIDALTSASEASRSTDLTNLYANMAVSLGSLPGSDTATEAGVTPETDSLGTLLSNALAAAQQNVTVYTNAYNTVSAQASTAEKEYNDAKTEEDSLQAALDAAETAVAG